MLITLNKEEYELLLKSGYLFEHHPDATGNYDRDIEQGIFTRPFEKEKIKSANRTADK